MSFRGKVLLRDDPQLLSRFGEMCGTGFGEMPTVISLESAELGPALRCEGWVVADAAPVLVLWTFGGQFEIGMDELPMGHGTLRAILEG